MARQDHRGNALPSRAGYFAAITISALGHAALFALVFFIAPRYLHSEEAAPPAYTVKIVDSIPAGDLGTHLPRLAPRKAEQIAKAEVPKPEEPAVEAPKPELAPDTDKNAVALETKVAETPTPTPTPETVVAPTPEPTESVTPRATPTPRPAPAAKRSPKAAPSIVIAKAEKTPSVSQRMAKLRQQMLKEDLKRAKAKAAEEAESDEDEPDEEPTTATTARPSGGGPVVANVASEGHGMGIGPGSGSAGIQQDLDFLLYYQQVQDRIKKAWTFTSGSSDLTATVNFAIGPDGTLTGVKIAKGSNDGAFDDSVLRAIRRAAPFPPPPEKYRDQWAGGIEALFKLGELKS
ncbi:MAG TPA: TonB family protein [Candidatus Binataceae bacterium]